MGRGNIHFQQETRLKWKQKQALLINHLTDGCISKNYTESQLLQSPFHDRIAAKHSEGWSLTLVGVIWSGWPAGEMCYSWDLCCSDDLFWRTSKLHIGRRIKHAEARTLRMWHLSQHKATQFQEYQTEKYGIFDMVCKAGLQNENGSGLACVFSSVVRKAEFSRNQFLERVSSGFSI